MVYYLTQVEFYGNEGNNSGIIIPEILSMTVKRGLDSKSNTTSLTVKNGLLKYNTNSNFVYDWTNDNNELQIGQNDIIKVYARESETADDVIDTTDNSLHLLTTAAVEEFSNVFDSKRTRLKVSCVDKTYETLSKIWANAYTSADAKTSPQILQEVIRAISDGMTGTGFDEDGNVTDPGAYGIDARLFSESIVDNGTTSSAASFKLIQSGQNFTSTVDKGDMVRNTTGTEDKYAIVNEVDSDTQLTLSKDIMASGDTYEIGDGFIQDTRINNSAFPTTVMSKVWKPVYEWCEDLSDVQVINTTAEIDGTPIQNRNMHYFIDEKNRFHWFYPDDEEDYSLTTGVVDDTVIMDMKLVKKTFDIVNMVIYNGGKDLDSLGTLNYYFNSTTELKTLKMKYIPMIEIARELREREFELGGISSINADETVTLASSYPYTTSWGDSVSSDSDYKESFRTEVIKQCDTKARAFTNKRASPRWAKSITTSFKNFNPGELLKINSRQYGMNDVLVRILDVTHQFSKGGITTTVDVEEDEPKLGEG